MAINGVSALFHPEIIAMVDSDACVMSTSDTLRWNTDDNDVTKNLCVCEERVCVCGGGGGGVYVCVCVCVCVGGGGGAFIWN